MSKRMILLTLKPQYQWAEISETTNISREVNKTLRPHRQEGCLIIDEYSYGKQTREKIAFCFMTKSDDEVLIAEINPIIEPWFELTILN